MLNHQKQIDSLNYFIYGSNDKGVETKLIDIRTLVQTLSQI